ncbi:hypothetical protein FOL47_004480 [Perkinsus chesapeaki]|uniref:Uncharacterized protein n=1 Tax=Perkinsus chesapeaki TaxID=330153 RepID=A0A7J6M276_PERCH|nr:hypothetical protein FOL47_004480 [Perkinsus chesapeaki]
MTGPQPTMSTIRPDSPYTGSYSPTWGSGSPVHSSPLRRSRSPALNTTSDIIPLGEPMSARRSLSSLSHTASTAALTSELMSQSARHAREVRGAVGESMQLRNILEKQEKKIAFLIGELKATRARLARTHGELQSASLSLDRLLDERTTFEQQLTKNKSTIRKLEGRLEAAQEELTRFKSAGCSKRYSDHSGDDSPKSVRSTEAGRRRAASTALMEAENVRLKEDLTRMEMELTVLKRALVLRSHELHVSMNDIQATARQKVETQQLRDEASSAKDEVEYLRGDCEMYRAEIDRLKTEVNHLSTSLSKSEKACRDIEKERDHAKQDAHLAALELKSAMDSAGHLPGQLEEAREKIRKLEEEISKKTGELSGVTTAQSAAASEWFHERALLSSKVDKYEQMLTEIGDERRQLREDLDKARLENTRLAADFQEAFERADTNEMSANLAREQLGLLESQIDSLRRDVAAGANEMKRRDAAARRLKTEVERGYQILRAASGQDRSDELVAELREGLMEKEEELRKLREGQCNIERSLVTQVELLKDQLDEALAGCEG